MTKESLPNGAAFVLACFFAFSVTIKVHGGIPTDVATPLWLVMAAGAIEVVVVVALALRWDVSAALTAMLLASVGMIVTYNAGGRCGCLGPVVMQRESHMVINGALGALAGVLAYSRRVQQSFMKE